MRERLSKKQREVLETVSLACQPLSRKFNEAERVVPLYIDHLPEVLFFTDGERRRFLENLERRGLLRIEQEFFIYITEAGKAAVSPNTRI